MNTYGINSEYQGYMDTSNTLHGAKLQATKEGYYNEVYVRYNNGYHVELVSTKVDNKWVDVYPTSKKENVK